MRAYLETWKPVEGYEELYEVSNLGNVRSLNYNHTGQVRVKKPVKNIYGYLQVGLHKEGKMKMCKVHRLVATAFIENPENLPCVNHIDEDKTNNRVSNLEWCTYVYNNNHGTRNERISEAQSEEVLQFTLDYVLVKEWSSVNECGRNGFNISCVSECCNNKYCSQGNVYKCYRWGYKKNYSIAKILPEYSCQSVL